MQEQTLRAAVDRIIPPDDYPGARDAGIGDYLARQFEGDLALEVDLFTTGLDALNAEALVRFNSRFINLTLEQQDTALAHIENGCKYCVGFACPADAKNGTHDTMIPRVTRDRSLRTDYRRDS